jgi:hypothetical protein
VEKDALKGFLDELINQIRHSMWLFDRQEYTRVRVVLEEIKQELEGTIFCASEVENDCKEKGI